MCCDSNENKNADVNEKICVIHGVKLGDVTVVVDLLAQLSSFIAAIKLAL